MAHDGLGVGHRRTEEWADSRTRNAQQAEDWDTKDRRYRGVMRVPPTTERQERRDSERAGGSETGERNEWRRGGPRPRNPQGEWLTGTARPPETAGKGGRRRGGSGATTSPGATRTAYRDGYSARVVAVPNKRGGKAQHGRSRGSRLLATCRHIPLEGMRVRN